MRTEPPASSARRRRGRRAIAIAALASAAAALLWWPFAYRYTSLGLDLEARDGDAVRCTFWRLRWPGDGSLLLAWLVEHRPTASGPVEPFDLGCALLQPPRELAPQGFWQRQGFWCVDVQAGEAAPPIVAGAERAFAVGVPHWLLVVAAVAIAGLSCGRRKRIAELTAAAAPPG